MEKEIYLKRYVSDPSVDHILLVECTDGPDAVAEYFCKDASSGGWKLQREGSALIGKNGPGKTMEGDGKTPLGDFGVLTAFGILPDPREDGRGLDYIDVKETTCACDEEGPFYNRIVDIAGMERPCTGEMMAGYTEEYAYGMALDYNRECEWPLGSAIFLHCKGRKTWTGGCVAVDRDYMLGILQTCGPSLRVIITAPEAASQPVDQAA